MTLSLIVIFHLIILIILFENKLKISYKSYYFIIGIIITSFMYSILYNNLYNELDTILEQIKLIY